jgi:hypothetical protein
MCADSYKVIEYLFIVNFWLFVSVVNCHCQSRLWLLEGFLELFCDFIKTSKEFTTKYQNSKEVKKMQNHARTHTKSTD